LRAKLLSATTGSACGSAFGALQRQIEKEKSRRLSSRTALNKSKAE